jgi:hypothetical protein
MHVPPLKRVSLNAVAVLAIAFTVHALTAEPAGAGSVSGKVETQVAANVGKDISPALEIIEQTVVTNLTRSDTPAHSGVSLKGLVGLVFSGIAFCYFAFLRIIPVLQSMKSWTFRGGN